VTYVEPHGKAETEDRFEDRWFHEKLDSPDRELEKPSATVIQNKHSLHISSIEIIRNIFGCPATKC
jgi:hypothetical protein